MVEDNYKYAKFSEILNRVTSRLKGFDKQVGEAEILEWCMQVETEYCPNVDNMYIYTQVPLKVINDVTIPPCNVWRISDVYDMKGGMHGHRVPYNDIGSRLVFSPAEHVTKVYIDYYGTPVDLETGEPLIQRGHEIACEWFCLYNIFFLDFGTGKINATFWHEISVNKEHEILACQSASVRFKTRDQLNQEQRIDFDSLPEPARLWLLRDERRHTVNHTVPNVQ
jgi:hypothetical protein